MSTLSTEKQLWFPAVLDACCGPRMMWFDSNDRRALFIDKRQETFRLGDHRPLQFVDPDIVADFTAMPFPDGQFDLVVFDPPHMTLREAGSTGNIPRLYGLLPDDWREVLQRGFAECFRVLRERGTLIFKWGSRETPLREVLELTPVAPLF